MWLFLPGGLLMPSIVPEGKGDPAFTNNGQWMLQVRARVKSHLENFIRDYMEDGTYSEIEATPQMDYNYRFYTTHEDFAFATAKAVLDIDYAKFKPTAERVDKDKKPLYKDGKEYHSVLNGIWSVVCRLGSPGGSWGKYSSTNPNGYRNAQEYYSIYERPRRTRGGANSRRWWEDDYDDASELPIGSSFLDEDMDMETWEQDQETLDKMVVGETLIDILKETGLDVGQWYPFMTDVEDEALKAYATQCFESVGSGKLKVSDLEPIEQEVVAHYFDEDWEDKLPVLVGAEDENQPPFENRDSNVQFQKGSQKPSQRKKNRGGRRNKKRDRVARGMHFN